MLQRAALLLALLLPAACSSVLRLEVSYEVPTLWSSSGLDNPPVPVWGRVCPPLDPATTRPVAITVKGRRYPVAVATVDRDGDWVRFRFLVPRFVSHIGDTAGIATIEFADASGKTYGVSAELTPVNTP